MAQRRMFTQKITESDSFTTLPPTTQCLYFHLCMSADDDGFSNKIRQAMFNAHADQNDFEMLVQKRFILPFDSGVIVIKHWRMHNLIRSDRYHETDYVEEKASLILKKNGVYTDVPPCGIPCDNQMATNGIPSDNQMEPEVRLGKVRLGYKESKEKKEDINYQEVADLYNDTCVSLPRLRTLSDSRKRAIKTLLKKHTLEELKEVFTKAEASDFMKGNNDRNWVANFDWIIKDSSFAKIIDGNYDNKTGAKPNKNSFMQNTYDFDALEDELRAN